LSDQDNRVNSRHRPVRQAEVSFIGDFPQFPVISSLLRDASLSATRHASPADAPAQAPAVYVCDAAHAPAFLHRSACIVVSADRSPQSIKQWLDAGASGVLTSPLAAPALLAGIQAHLPAKPRAKVIPWPVR
jgi:hypothetical protein